MPESILLDITTVIVLGIGAQWIAWQFRLPSILLLLLSGFLAGPVLGILEPAALQGDWVFAFVSISIGIILFEGGLSLRLSELQEVGSAVRNLITVGVLVTWALGGVGAYYLLGFNVPLAVLLGAILTVTGPTVIVPLLRHVRPSGRISTIAKWEGITIDPVGAILAVLVLETLLLLNEPAAAIEAAGHAAGGGHAGWSHAAEAVARGLLLEVVVALGVGVVAFGLLLAILRRRMVPDFLRNPVTLMVVVAAFVVSNELQQESGLLTTTLMGIALANQPYVSVQRIIEFKENLQVLLIGSLFIVLSGRLEMSALQYIDTNALIFLGGLVFIVRPLAVLVSSLGTQLKLKEQLFLGWMAPRGIVAAAVASLFAFELRSVYPQQVEALVPIVFLIIVGTVAIYGLTAAPLARWLGLAEPNPQGLLFVGAEHWVRSIASTVQDLGHQVLLIDNNPSHVEAAQERGLPARRANALSESTLDDLDMSGIGRLLITIPNDEVGSLTALHFSEIFETTDIFQLAAQPSSRRGSDEEMPQHLRGRPLFGEDSNYQSMQEMADRGGEVRIFKLADNLPDDLKKEYYTWSDLSEFMNGTPLIPLFLLRSGQTLEVVSELDRFRLNAADRLVAFVDPDAPVGGDPSTESTFEVQTPDDAIRSSSDPVGPDGGLDGDQNGEADDGGGEADDAPDDPTAGEEGGESVESDPASNDGPEHPPHGP